MAYITVAELNVAMGPQMVLQMFDDQATNTVYEPSVDAVVARASALVDSWIAPVYTGTFPMTFASESVVPGMILELAVQYAVAIAYERHPDYANAIASSPNKDRFARADALGLQLQAAIRRIPDMPGQLKPVNVTGAILYDDGRRVIADNPDGTTNSGDF